MTLRHYSDYQMLCVWEQVKKYQQTGEKETKSELHYLTLTYRSTNEGHPVEKAIEAIKEEMILRYVHMIEGMTSGMEDQEGESC